MAADFEDALTRFETLLTQDALGADEVNVSFRALCEERPLELPFAQLQRFMTICYRLMGLAGSAPVIEPRGEPRGDDRFGVGYAAWSSRWEIEAIFQDKGAHNRDWIEECYRYELALRNPDKPELSEYHIPAYSAAITYDQAVALAAPYLQHLETQMSDSPLAHYKLCWDVIVESPLPPYPQVFRDWLADLDARGVGMTPHLASFDRAWGLVELAKNGRQHLNWDQVETVFLPELATEHPLVAAALARFLGTFYSDPKEFDRILSGTPWPLVQVLDYLADLPRNRRHAAGGFLNGIADYDEPFSILKEQATGFDIENWALRVFAQSKDEPYIPTAQAFWFYVHEYFWSAPDFAMRLIDAGHVWEAFMCATEGPLSISGMTPVLTRIAKCDDEKLAQKACDALGRGDQQVH